MKKHIELIGILHIVYHSMGLVFSSIVLILVLAGGVCSGDEYAAWMALVIVLAITALVALFSVPGIIGGIGLLKMKSWARILVLIMGFLSLLEIPFGTALGIYTIWALMNNETMKLFYEA